MRGIAASSGLSELTPSSSLPTRTPRLQPGHRKQTLPAPITPLSGEARTILLLHIISVRPSKQTLMVRTFLKVYMELGNYFLFLQEQIKDIIILQTHPPPNFHVGSRSTPSSPLPFPSRKTVRDPGALCSSHLCCLHAPTLHACFVSTCSSLKSAS